MFYIGLVFIYRLSSVQVPCVLFQFQRAPPHLLHHHHVQLVREPPTPLHLTPRTTKALTLLMTQKNPTKCLRLNAIAIHWSVTVTQLEEFLQAQTLKKCADFSKSKWFVELHVLDFEVRNVLCLLCMFEISIF